MVSNNIMMPMDIGDGDSYGDELYYDEEMDPLMASGDMEGGAVY